MNFDYIRMLSYAEITQFITEVLGVYFKTNLLVKPTNVKVKAVTQEVEFEAVLSNGKYVTGNASCADFSCKIQLDGNVQTDLVYNKEWAEYMFNTLKTKTVGDKPRLNEIYKADYNDYCNRVKSEKYAEAEKEFENSLLR